jgi:hypothetical protein
MFIQKEKGNQKDYPFPAFQKKLVFSALSEQSRLV